MMVVSAVELPLLFVAVRVYVRVEVGVIVIEPVEVADWLPMPWLMDTDEAFVVVQERVLETPGSISEKDAEKEEIVGSRLLGVTLFEADDDAEFPAAFVATTVKVYTWPFVRPMTLMGLPVLEAVWLPVFEVAV
jgi:hypothetical protein